MTTEPTDFPSEVTDLNAERNKREAPAPEFVRMHMGVKWYAFAASYKDGDHQLSFHFWALNMEDAERRVGLMRETLTFDGQVYEEGSL